MIIGRDVISSNQTHFFFKPGEYEYIIYKQNMHKLHWYLICEFNTPTIPHPVCLAHAVPDEIYSTVNFYSLDHNCMVDKVNE